MLDTKLRVIRQQLDQTAELAGGQGQEVVQEIQNMRLYSRDLCREINTLQAEIGVLDNIKKEQSSDPTSASDAQGRHCPTLAGMARVETPVSFAHLICFLAILSCFLPLCHRILPIVSPVFEIFKTPGMAIAIPAILVSPPLVMT